MEADVEDPKQELETKGAAFARLSPAFVGSTLPDRIRWTSRRSRLRVRRMVRGPAAFTRAVPSRASRVSEPSRGESPSEVSRYPALTRGSRVLLVDDDPQHRIPLLRALRDQGHSVLHAADGPSGEGLCRASQFEIDALVARADMKAMCGFELARRVCRMQPAVRVLLMWRCLERPEDARRAYERGYAVIPEPFTPEELCRRLTDLLGSSRSGTGAQVRLDGEDRLLPPEDEVLDSDSKKEN